MLTRYANFVADTSIQRRHAMLFLLPGKCPLKHALQTQCPPSTMFFFFLFFVGKTLFNVHRKNLVLVDDGDAENASMNCRQVHVDMQVYATGNKLVRCQCRSTASMHDVNNLEW